MRKETLDILMSSKNEHWNTPAEVLAPIHQTFGGIDLDPCSNDNSRVSAKTSYRGPTVDVDGLTASWQTNGLVFVNPPYGRKMKPWIQKCADEAKKSKDLGNRTEIILLGPARTDTNFFQKIVCPTADKVLFWEGRITFLGAEDPAPFPSFLSYWGHRPDKFMIAFLGKGWFM